MSNSIFTYEGADILGQLVAGHSEYTPNMVYVEFQNGGTPPTVVPTRDGGRNYYAGLAGSPTQDYLRIPLLINAQLASTNLDNFSSNLARWMLLTGGTAGVNGLPFSAADGSQVYGFALVSAPDASDASRDLVFARMYPDTPIPKVDGAEVQARWAYRFT